ncbi:MAG: cytidylate kinase-like family protein [Deltaproteobacteria bacterium]|nr:cytidylate kinase-like family protein [Deltaproteobacteria bacterium]MBW2532975.1 cytidylate kinase-like family protein [Deltaproteobacteria bacterium]
MTIITISRGSYSWGREVAEKVASRLKYQCVSREVLLRASDRFDVPEVALEHAVKDAPSLLDRITGGKPSYVAYVQSALARHVQRDDVVYHGLAGHVLLKNVRHVLKVRVVADRESRIEGVRKRDGLNRRAAESLISKLDSERRKWTRSLYGVDPQDPTLYDLLLNVTRFSVSGVADMVVRAAKMKPFATTKDSQQQLDDLVLASQVKARVVDTFHDVFVTCRHGNMLVYCAPGERHRQKVKRAVRGACRSLAGVKNLEVHPGVAPPKDAV